MQIDSSLDPIGMLQGLVSFFFSSQILSGSFCQSHTYAQEECFLPPGLIFNQTQAFCFRKAHPKCLEMPCFILTFTGEAAKFGICSESLFSYILRQQLQLHCLCGSASSVNTQLRGLDSNVHLKFLRKLKSEHGLAGVLIPTLQFTKDTQSS